MEWLGDFARDYGGDAMVTDDLSAYKSEVERLGLDHQTAGGRSEDEQRD